MNTQLLMIMMIIVIIDVVIAINDFSKVIANLILLVCHLEEMIHDNVLAKVIDQFIFEHLMGNYLIW